MTHHDDLGYRDLLRAVQGSERTGINKAAFDQCIRVFEKCKAIEPRKNRREGGIIRATSSSKIAFKRYSNILKIPDIDTRNFRLTVPEWFVCTGLINNFNRQPSVRKCQ